MRRPWREMTATQSGTIGWVSSGSAWRNTPEAASAYEAAVVRDDSKADWHYRLGLSQRSGTEKYAEAASAYEAAVARDDSNAEWHYRLGLVRERTRNTRRRPQPMRRPWRAMTATQSGTIGWVSSGSGWRNTRRRHQPMRRPWREMTAMQSGTLG